MNTLLHANKLFATLLIAVATFFVGVTDAFAHCDTMNGPVVLDARKALELGNVEPVLKWVAPDDEAEVKAAFARTLNVRDTSAEVREMADLYFFETVVRLHRMSEGVGYTGLKPAAAVEPAIAAADRALVTGSIDALSDLLVDDVRATLAEHFAHAYEARAHAGDSVEAGRAFVRAYVRFTHLAEEIGAAAVHAAPKPSAPSVHAH